MEIKGYHEQKKEQVQVAKTGLRVIKEVGLSPQNPAVVNWAEQELGVSANEFGKLLRNSETPQEAQNNVLELMEAPKELIDTSIKNSSVKKKV